MDSLNSLNHELELEFYGKKRLEEILEILAKRNNFLLNGFHPDSKIQCANTCKVYTSPDEITEFSAFHSGPRYRYDSARKVITDSPVSELIGRYGGDFEGKRHLHHVHFSTDLDFIISNHLLPHENEILYTIDLRNSKDSRLQTNYTTEVFFIDKIRTLRQCLETPGFFDRLKASQCQNAEYLVGLNNLNDVRSALINELDSWIEKYSTPLDISRLKEYVQKGMHIVLVKDPIKIVK